jgi:transglutaminase-like putative cysteine protease
VLLAALCRARGIAARAALGLVYVARNQEFAYHMWTEAYIGGKWIPLD